MSGDNFRVFAPKRKNQGYPQVFHSRFVEKSENPIETDWFFVKANKKYSPAIELSPVIQKTLI